MMNRWSILSLLGTGLLIGGVVFADAQGVLVYESLGVFRGDFVEVHMSLVNR